MVTVSRAEVLLAVVKKREGSVNDGQGGKRNMRKWWNGRNAGNGRATYDTSEMAAVLLLRGLHSAVLINLEHQTDFLLTKK